MSDIRNVKEEFRKIFPSTLFDEKEFKFSTSERETIMFATLQKAFAQEQINMADKVIQQVLHSIAMPRVGYESKKGMGVIHQPDEGTFILFIPRNWCKNCKQNAGVHQYNQSWYCEECFNLIQNGKKDSN